MNKRIRIIAFSLIVSMLCLGCQPVFSESYVEKAIDDIKEEAVKSLKKALKKEIEEFFASDDLAGNLGISSQDMKKIEQSIRNYVDNYEFDEESLKEIKASVEYILNNAEGLSAEELENKIKQVFEN